MVSDGKQVRTLRKRRGWTQQELALNSGTTERTVQRIEASKAVSIDSLRLVASALQVDFSELLPTSTSFAQTATANHQDAALQRQYDLRQQLRELVTKLSDFWEKEIPGSRLTEREKKKFERWLGDFSYEDILAAMGQCIRQYVELSPNGLCTADSAELAFDKIPAVCKVSKFGPEERDLYYIRGAIRKRLSRFDDRQAIALLRAAHKSGASIERLRAFGYAANTWEEFKEGLQILCQSPTTELQNLQRTLPTASPEVMRALERGNIRTIGESVAIIAATKQMAASPTEIAAEILKRGCDFGELVITIDFDGGVYYFGRSRDGEGRTYGIHEPWTVRELADAIRNGLNFLDP
jgi:transcriptional regulator with XRE-family HTH domain